MVPISMIALESMMVLGSTKIHHCSRKYNWIFSFMYSIINLRYVLNNKLKKL